MKMNNKKKGYVLALVIVLALVMTITVTSAFTIIMRYMFFAKDNLQNVKSDVAYIDVVSEVNAYAYV